jgi:hypothetical protein
MSKGYTVKIISPDRKNKLMEQIYSSRLYERKALVHGSCIKLFTDNCQFKEMWEENFDQMPDWIRPHGRVFAVNSGKGMKVLYEPSSKTVMIFNCDYYGWIKSIALGLVADFFEDFTSEHKRFSVHGSFVDCRGRGIAITGPSKSGKTTLTYGLLLEENYNFLTDDWFFVRLAGDDTRIYSAEKNSYIRENLGKDWPQFKSRLKNLKLDKQGRAIVDVKRFFGYNRIRQSSNLDTFVILTRDKKLPPMQRLRAKAATEYMEKHDFCNPHQIIRNARKQDMRKNFFRELFSRVPVYLLNTIETPKESLARIKELSPDYACTRADSE